MIDIETLSTRVDAFILQIAAVPFDIDTDQIGDEASRFNLHINGPSQEGRHIGLDTVTWWMDQDAEARNRVFKPRNRHNLKDALHLFRQYYTRLRHPVIWSNGPEFDSAILKHAFEQAGLQTPWHHRKVRDLRTMKQLCPAAIPRERDPDPVLHDPEVDCVEQIRDLAWHVSGGEMRRTARLC
jgi:hypothetical protein